MSPYSSAARKAARSAIFRILPPVTLNCRARKVKSTSEPRGAWGETFSRSYPVRFFREREFDGHVHSADKGVVNVFAEVRRQNRDAVILLHLLKQVADFDIGVAVVGVFDFGAFAENCVRFIEEEDRISLLGSDKDLVEILLGFADVLADQCRDRPYRARDRDRWRRFPPPLFCRCRKDRQRVYSVPFPSQDVDRNPKVRALFGRCFICEQISRSCDMIERQHDVIPVVGRRDFVGKCVEFAARLPRQAA